MGCSKAAGTPQPDTLPHTKLQVAAAPKLFALPRGRRLISHESSLALIVDISNNTLNDTHITLFLV